MNAQELQSVLNITDINEKNKVLSMWAQGILEDIRKEETSTKEWITSCKLCSCYMKRLVHAYINKHPEKNKRDTIEDLTSFILSDINFFLGEIENDKKRERE